MDRDRTSEGAAASKSQTEPDNDQTSATQSGKAVKKKYYELLKFQDLPDFLRTNEYILKHYRSGLPLRHVFASLFTIHNETLNIWTHLVGFFIFVGLTFYTVMHLPGLVDLPQLEKLRSAMQENITSLVTPLSPTNRDIPMWPFFVFLSGSICCLLCSSTYHLLNCYSERFHTVLHQMDHTGIAILIMASFYPPVYYSFMCDLKWRNVYLMAITTLGTLTILFSSLPLFRTPEFRPIRAMLFLSMGVSGIVPAVHVLVLYGDEPIAVKTFWYEVGMASFYGIGAVLYATRIPERLKPGTFDIVGHSHQIFHVLVVAGAYTHYKAGLLMLNWRDSASCP